MHIVGGSSLLDLLRAKVRAHVLAWLGLADTAALIAGQRADHDRLAMAVQTEVETLGRMGHLLQQTQSYALSAHGRLHYYEQHVVPIRSAHRSLVERAQREQRRAEAEAKLAAGPVDLAPAKPDMSEDVASA